VQSNSSLPFPERSWGARLWFRLSYKVINLLLHLVARVQIIGKEHIPTAGGVVLASNHISLLDTLLIPCSVMASQGVQVVWAPAKIELFGLPLIGRMITSWGAFPVRRGRGDVHAMRRMISYMRTEKLMLFPEGTRSRDGQLGEGKRAVGKLLHEARPVVIPAAVWGTDRIWPRGRYLPRLRTSIGVCYGEPLNLQQLYMLPNTKETAGAIVGEVMAGIQALLETVPPRMTDVSCSEASAQGIDA
jgi:1-acyl-sn-glycerol-3-phosphate acyltransferase